MQCAYESKFPQLCGIVLVILIKLNWVLGHPLTSNSVLLYMARLNYNLMDRYLLTVTGRWDGASMLAAGNKWDFFPISRLLHGK